MFERGDVKVDEQPCRTSGQSQIREQLRKVNRGEFGHALHFDDYTGVDNEIDSECPAHDQLLVSKRQILLHFYHEPALPKFHVHAGQVCRFQQTRPEYSVYFDSRSDYFACDRVDLPRVYKRHDHPCATVLPSRIPLDSRIRRSHRGISCRRKMLMELQHLQQAAGRRRPVGPAL